MGMELQSTGPSPPKKSILKPSRLGGSISPFTSIGNKSIPADLPFNWRKEGKELRFELLKGDVHNVFSITHSIPLDNYMEIIHRVSAVLHLSAQLNYISRPNHSSYLYNILFELKLCRFKSNSIVPIIIKQI